MLVEGIAMNDKKTIATFANDDGLCELSFIELNL
jgi:hypothetical protein